MKFMHLADLHIGKNVNGFSMLDEQRHVFKQILEHIKIEHLDAVIIAGDVYDRAVPGVDAVRVFDDFLTELADADVAVLLISGNHDSPERLNYASRLLSDKRIFMCGTFDGEPRKIVLSDDYGEVNFWLLPFIKPSYLHGIKMPDGCENKIDSYSDAVSAAIYSIKTADSTIIDYNSRNVLVSHQFYIKSGTTPLRSESELSPVGGLDAVECDMLAPFDYVALGHLHGAQKVGSENIRYAGSPVKYSFSECRQVKSATIVELCEKGNLSISAIPLEPIHDMREIRGEIEKLMSDVVSEREDIKEREDYLRVILTNEEEIIDPMGKIRSVYPNVMALDFENSRTVIDISDISNISQTSAGSRQSGQSGQTEQLSPYELFSEFFLDMNGSVMSEEQAGIIRNILDSSGLNN